MSNNFFFFSSMKKCAYLVAAVLMAVQLSSCAIGSYACFNKVNDFNTNLTGNKFVNGVVGYFLAPIDLGVAGFLDVVIFNTMEFWTGSNPMAATQIVTGEDGMHYALATDKKGGYTVTCQETGKVVDARFDQYARTWTIMSEGEVVSQFAMTSPTSAELLN